MNILKNILLLFAVTFCISSVTNAATINFLRIESSNDATNNWLKLTLTTTLPASTDNVHYYGHPVGIFPSFYDYDCSCYVRPGNTASFTATVIAGVPGSINVTNMKAGSVQTLTAGTSINLSINSSTAPILALPDGTIYSTILGGYRGGGTGTGTYNITATNLNNPVYFSGTPGGGCGQWTAPPIVNYVSNLMSIQYPSANTYCSAPIALNTFIYGAVSHTIGY